MNKVFIILTVVIILSFSAYAITIYIPGDYPTIQAGIDAAVDGDTVIVDDGTYTGEGNKNIDFLGKAIVVISENGPDRCVIDCEDDGRGFYFHANEDTNSVLSGFTITNGNAGNGGGISCANSSPIIDSCIISGNSANYHGGGIYCGEASNSAIINCIINGNTAGNGGGICTWSNSCPVIDQCIINGNSASDGGGILCTSYNAYITISNCTITGNSAYAGGGINCGQTGLTIYDCTINENTAYHGGGIHCDWWTDPIISHCTISENTATDWGGGGILCDKSTATIEYCVISRNSTSGNGGGVYGLWYESRPSFSYCLIYGNSAGGQGGGIFCSEAAFIRNCTIVENSAGAEGGGILYGGYFINPILEIENSIVEGNTGIGGIFFYSSDSVDISYGDYYNNEGGDFLGNIPPGLGEITTINANGDSCDIFNNIFEDPLFEDPMNGNFQITWANFPVPDSTRSPCIDAGDPESPLDPDSTIADMGAFYYDQSEATVVPGGNVSGIWEVSGSPYLIEGDITIPSGETLNIEPGVEVIFQGYYIFTVNGFLEAVGIPSDSILFTAADTSERWRGIRFNNAPDGSLLEYCIIQYGHATGYEYENCGGGIHCYISNPTIINSLICDNLAAWHGGGIWCENSDPIISYTTITRNSAITGGGGGICGDSSPTISYCTISENSADYDGGGISYGDGNPTIIGCFISGNSAAYGGGIYIYKSLSTIENCIISGNSADWKGGGIFCEAWAAPSPTIINCTISGNSAGLYGGGMCWQDADPDIVNTIVEGNIGGGIYFYDPQAEITYGDFFNNEGGNFTGSVPPGLGEIVAVNANGDSCDIFNNIFEDPLFADPMNGNFQITWANFPVPDSTKSPCIDAGDPESPLDPDSTIADMGAFYFDQGAAPPISITLTPYNPPIVIPPGGDAFAFNIELANNGNEQTTFDAWVNIEVPGGFQFTILEPVYNLTLEAGSSIERDRTVFVPGSAPAGEYICMGMIGTYPWNVIDSDGFPFIKEGADGIWKGSEGWICSGEPFPGEDITAEEALPEKIALHSAFPNPFNASTTLSYSLPKAGKVSLIVYDVQGREVAKLVDGYRSAGAYKVVFDAKDLVSGVYFARLTAGEFRQTRKVLLVK